MEIRRQNPEDPYLALGAALGAVIRKELRDALAEVTVPNGDTASMVDVPETARRIGLSPSKTKRLIASGDLGSVLVGRRRLVPVSAIDDYVHALRPEQLQLRLETPARRAVRPPS
jgi:excisionase family DNA binding protein